MKSLTCKNCGGTMVLDASAMTAVCHYCGTRFLLDHADTDYYRDFFSRMSEFLSLSEADRARKEKAEALWENAPERVFLCKDGTPIEVKYMYSYSGRDADVYVARRNIIFHFREDGPEMAERFRRGVSLLEYPAADAKNLADHFPKISGGFALEDDSFILVLSKHEDEYPLRLFGTLPGRHVAWIISRMENICCVLEYSALVHPQIDPDTLYINPYTHQAALYGNWWNAGRNNTFRPGSRELLRMEQNLTGLRDTAASLLGFSGAGEVRTSPGVPEALAAFLRSRPHSNAYDDFSLWDDMLLRAYGERKFIRMDTDDAQVYGGKG